MRKTIAVDFDGCLCINRWPEIGEPRQQVINELVRAQAEGARLILWTCREGEALDVAIMWCLNHGLRFDAVNDNLPEHTEQYGNNCRKVFADEYWDDKAVDPQSPSCDNCALRRNSTKRTKSIYSWCANTCKNYRAKV